MLSEAPISSPREPDLLVRGDRISPAAGIGFLIGSFGLFLWAQRQRLAPIACCPSAGTPGWISSFYQPDFHATTDSICVLVQRRK